MRCVNDAVARGVRRLLLYAPTGSGKTVMAGAFAEPLVRGGAPPGDVLFLANRRELVLQAREKFVEAGVPREGVGVIAATVREPRDAAAPVQIASVDTLRLLPRGSWPRARHVILDECHHAPASTYRELLAAYPGAFHLGLSATPCRLDGRGFDGIYDEMVVAAQTHELLKAGYLAAPRVYSHPDAPDVSDLRAVRGDYPAAEVARRVDRAALVGDIVEHWKRLGGGHRTVAFAASVPHAEHIRDAFARSGVAAEALSGRSRAAAREGALARLKSGDTRVLVVVDVVSEGWDLPEVKCVVFARPTKSLRLFLQWVGRAMRPWGGVTPVVLDHAGNVRLFGLPTVDRAFSLDGAPPTPAPGDAVRVCGACHAANPPSAAACEACGAPLTPRRHPPPPATPAQVEGELREVPLAAALGLDLIIFGASDAERRAFSEAAAARGLDTEQWAHALAIVATGGAWPEARAPITAAAADVGSVLTIEPTAAERAAFDAEAAAARVPVDQWIRALARRAI